MRVGVPKEVKDQENRVGLTPGSVEAFVSEGHTVLVETGAGLNRQTSSAVARTSTYALNNATLPYALNLAKYGWQEAAARDRHLAAGVCIIRGELVSSANGGAVMVSD